MRLMMKAAATAMLLAAVAGAGPSNAAPLSLTRLDCGTIHVKEFNSYFSDTLEYPPGPRDVVVSCYLIHWADKYMLWDSGYPASFKGKMIDRGAAIGTLRQTIPDQLAAIGLKPSDINVVALSHSHIDHSGQAADFPGARLVVGKSEFENPQNKTDPFTPWRSNGANVTLADGDVDIFGDGSVVALSTPGHTSGHLSLLVKLKSGPVLLSGDLYHAAIAREKRGMPPGSYSRAETLASMDRFERLAKQLHAKIIIGHEPADIAKLPSFPSAAR